MANFNVLQTVLEVSLGIAYIFVISMIVTSKRKNFKNPFYTLFIATGFVDVAAIYISIFFRFIREVGIGPEFKPLVLPFMVTSGVTFIGHMIGNTVIALNRYSALCMMKKYDKIWTRRNVRIIVVLQYFVALIAVSPLIGAQLLYTSNMDGTYLYAGMDERSDVINKITAIAFCVAYALVSGLTNIKLLVGWHRLSTLGGSSRYSRQEKSLLFYALFVFASSSLMCAQQFTKAYSIYTGNDKLKAWVVMQWFWINDVMISIPPFFMLLLSADLRMDCANFILCKSRESGNNTVMVATRTHHSALGKDSNSNLDRRSRVSTY